MKKATLFLALFIFSQTIFAQAPDWAVKEHEYQYTMTFIAKLNVNGKQLIRPNDKVAAFVGNICRGVSGVTYVASEKNYYAFITAFANQQGESLTFKLYDSSTGKITTVDKQIVFVVNAHKGNLFQSYSIAQPTLNYQADILSFNFFGINNSSSVIDNGAVKVNIAAGHPITGLKPVFTLSKGATLFKNRIIQKSGEVTEDFSSSITYDVLSEDESTLHTYKISVTQAATPTLFYKKDAVCYAGGAIKIVSQQEGASVRITSNGKTVATKQISNGEALFLNLDSGSYVATVGNEWKRINIHLKVK
ncbi:hypothetical protein DJ568_07450 [Mucilaginibacter hurinus]|uniref:T9SS C-terminal target domain-containing protein n=1 Tax=Mucilaginibacter hurinus TaxID=2201324 RepID=A0A367GQI4_9SPHI|nr:hypothetical protein [Mucilaginibacter hurinus]RCH55712.1 hypothetical protein DJ568_07450 [Mucilaginibacter hurinus]